VVATGAGAAAGAGATYAACVTVVVATGAAGVMIIGFVAAMQPRITMPPLQITAAWAGTVAKDTLASEARAMAALTKREFLVM
jgi:hypothetical protein